MRSIGGVVTVVAMGIGIACAHAQDRPPPGSADIKAYHTCQNTQVKKLDNGKRAPEKVAKSLADHCQKEYEAMSAAVLGMFGRPVWMSNYDSSLATVRANRNPNSPLNRAPDHAPPPQQHP
jgi:hypothetical protein